MEARQTTLEGALIRTESDIEAALKAATAVVSQLKRAKKAAAVGVLRDLERSLDSAEQLAGALRDSVRGARAGWTFDDRAYLGVRRVRKRAVATRKVARACLAGAGRPSGQLSVAHPRASQRCRDRD